MKVVKLFFYDRTQCRELVKTHKIFLPSIFFIIIFMAQNKYFYKIYIICGGGLNHNNRQRRDPGRRFALRSIYHNLKYLYP